MSEPDAFVLLNKPPGVTSFESLGWVKRALATRRVGHTGTLDRFAEGLIIALCGGMTRLAPYLVANDKEYEAVVRFGAETDTLDPEGRVVLERPVPELSAIEAVLPRFVGRIMQVPPAFSAVHVGGKRAYAIARSGGEVQLRERETEINSIEVLDFHAPDLSVRVRCAKGTYIRSLARDLARAAGSCAHVARLVRTRSGRFKLEDAVAPDEFRPERDLKGWEECLKSIGGVALSEVRRADVPRVRAGSQLDDRCLVTAPADDGLVALFDENRRFLALTRRAGGSYRYEFVARPGSVDFSGRFGAL